jgi:hypothetical protein
MELKQRYIRDSGYDLEDDFTDALLEVNPLLAYKIGRYIEDNVVEMPNNNLCCHVLGGIVIFDGEPVAFALEMIKQNGMVPSLSNLIFITVDEYLDLINLNYYIKSNETRRNTVANNKRSILAA